MTMFRWLTSFNQVQSSRMGQVNDLSWMHVHAWKVGEPGETPHYFLLERAGGEARVIKSLTSKEVEQAVGDPAAFWDHPDAEVPSWTR